MTGLYTRAKAVKLHYARFFQIVWVSTNVVWRATSATRTSGRQTEAHDDKPSDSKSKEIRHPARSGQGNIEREIPEMGNVKGNGRTSQSAKRSYRRRTPGFN